MQVAMLVDKPVPDERPTGIGVAAFNMALALSRRRNFVFLICRGRAEKTTKLNEFLTMQTIRRFSRDNLSATLSLLKQGGCSIVHVHSSAAAPGLIASWALGRGVFFHSHGDQPLHPIALTLVRDIEMRLSRRVIAVSESTRKDIIRNHNVSPGKVVVAYNGVDADEFRPLAPAPEVLRRHGLDGYDKIILSIGAIQQRKGQATMVECLPEILKTYPHLIYVNVGNPYDEGFQKQLEDRAKELGVAGAVRMLTGIPRSELVGMINAATLCVHPSIHEPFGLAVVEEMACAKAVLAFGVDAIPEIIDDNVDGVLVKANSTADLTKSILDTLGDSAGIRRLGEKARKKVADSFTWDRTAARLESIYHGVSS